MKWKLGTLAGIGVYVHWTFWLLPLFILFSAGGLQAGLSTLGLVFAIFGCVVLHELGHAMAARYFGIGTRDITLYPIGGVARLNFMPRKPSQELVIALAGPLVNVVLALVILAALVLIEGAGAIFDVPIWGGSFLPNLMVANIAMVVFNLLPAFPMDGGRVLRAVLAAGLPYEHATRIAARVGQGFAVLLGLAGLVWTPSLLLVAIFVFLAARAEANMVTRQAQWERHPYARPGAILPGSIILEPADPRGISWVTEVRYYPSRQTWM